MKRRGIGMKALYRVASLFALTLPIVAAAITINVVSDENWTVSDTDTEMVMLGNAQNVCLTPTVPTNCPVAATGAATPTLYGYNLLAWTADLSTPQWLSSAKWIWASKSTPAGPQITGLTTQAEKAQFTLKQVFALCGTPKSGTIFLAADDFAEVLINDVSVVSSTDNSTITSYTLTGSDLSNISKLNTIKIKVRNGLNPSGVRQDNMHAIRPV
jgi:hypothetical protein